jgi:hypothetical protein
MLPIPGTHVLTFWSNTHWYLCNKVHDHIRWCNSSTIGLLLWALRFSKCCCQRLKFLRILFMERGLPKMVGPQHYGFSPATYYCHSAHYSTIIKVSHHTQVTQWRLNCAMKPSTHIFIISIAFIPILPLRPTSVLLDHTPHPYFFPTDAICISITQHQ